jgi:hypothetical protein
MQLVVFNRNAPWFLRAAMHVFLLPKDACNSWFLTAMHLGLFLRAASQRIFLRRSGFSCIAADFVIWEQNLRFGAQWYSDTRNEEFIRGGCIFFPLYTKIVCAMKIQDL